MKAFLQSLLLLLTRLCFAQMQIQNVSSDKSPAISPYQYRDADYFYSDQWNSNLLIDFVNTKAGRNTI